MSAFRVRRGAIGDLNRLVEIETAVFQTDLQSRRSLRRALSSLAASVLVAERSGRVEGYALVAFRAGARIARLYSIARAAQAGRGCGRALLQAAEDEARRRGCAALRLEVREDNRAALTLYQAAGFRPFGRYADYYQDGAPALRLEKDLREQSDWRQKSGSV